jgi:hypothetical protein
VQGRVWFWGAGHHMGPCSFPDVNLLPLMLSSTLRHVLFPAPPSAPLGAPGAVDVLHLP